MSALPPVNAQTGGAAKGVAPVTRPQTGGTPVNLPRGGVVSLAIKDRAGLYAAYMSFIQGGGIFVPSSRPYKLGEEVMLMLSLIDNPTKWQVQGKIVWLTPAGTPNKTPGIGVQFADNDDGRALKKTIEDLLGRALGADRATQTI